MSKSKPGIFEQPINHLLEFAKELDERAMEWDKQGMDIVASGERDIASAYRDAARVLRIVGGVKIRKYGKLGDGIDIPSEDKLVAVIKRLRRRAERGKK